MSRKLIDGMTNLRSALVKLESAATIPNDRELVVEGTIQRFEVVVELYWKTMKRALEYEGVHPATPRDSLKAAFKIGWLHDEAIWLDLLDRRNTTSHQYLDEELIENNYEDIKKVVPELRRTFTVLEARYAGLIDQGRT